MWRSKGQAEAPTCLEKHKKWATYQTAELPQKRESLLINNRELWWRMKSWVLAFLNWSWGWHIKRKCQTDRLRFHLDISRCVWNRENDLRLVHVKTVINFVLRDESGTRERRRKPQADSSTRLKMWAHAFLPCFHVRVIMCALSRHFFKWFLILTQKSDFPQPWAFRGILQYKNMILTIAHIFRQTRSISVWESTGLLTYVQRMSYVLNIACKWETLYMTLWEEKNEVLLLYLTDRPGDWSYWPSFLLTRSAIWLESCLKSLPRGHQADLDDRG